MNDQEKLQQVRERVASKLRQLVLIRKGKDALETIWLKEADAFLSLPDIGIISDEQTIPLSLCVFNDSTKKESFIEETLKDAGFVRLIKKEK